MKLETLSALNEARRARRPALLVTDLASGEERLVNSEALASDPLVSHLDAALRIGKSALVETF